MVKKRLVLPFIFLNFFFINAQISFTEIATSIGVVATYNGTASEFFAGGISFCDFDGDGWDDLTFSTSSGESVKFFKNDGDGTFTQISLSGVVLNNDRALQVLWIDYDNDSDKDLFIVSHNGSNKLYQNNGSFLFTDVTTSAGINTASLYSFGSSWGDYNNDGYLDMYLSVRDESEPYVYFNTLYQNDGDGTFTDVSVSAGLDTTNGYLSFCSAFFDYDNDGWQDIYIANDKLDNKNIMYHNNGDGTFTDTSILTGTDVGIDAMSTTIDDYDNDGDLDIYVTNSFDGNVFFVNNGDGTFTDVASTNGTLMESWAWGAVFLDADNDMDTDLYVSAMLETAPAIILPSAFYENNGNGIFSIPASAGFQNDDKISFSNAIGDVDNDGYPDIAVLNRESNHFVFQNNNSSNNYLKVKLEGTTSNKDGIGSWIQAYNNGVSQNRYTLSGEGFLSQNSNTEFFGLGTETVVDSLKVKWLSGVVDVFYDVAVNQSLTIVESSSLSVDEYSISNTIKVFPNPSLNGVFELKTAEFDSSKKYKIVVYDTFGRVMIQQEMNLDNNPIDLKNYSKGIYFLEITSKNQSIVKKLIYN